MSTDERAKQDKDVIYNKRNQSIQPTAPYDPLQSVNIATSGPGSVVGTVTAYVLDGPGIESRWGEIFRTCPDRP